MLALTDEALAQVLIAATAVEPEGRSAWLMGLAHRLDEQPSPPALAPSTARTRQWRKRQQNGRVRLAIEIDEALLAVGLVDRNLLVPSRADDKRALAAAATKALVMFCEGGDASPHDERIRDRLRAEFAAVIRKKAHARLPRSNPKGARSPARCR